MELVFPCLQSGGLFRSADYEIVAFRGVVENAAGEKTLEARVRLKNPCPLCGARHEYAAAELPCPFEAGDPGGRNPSGESGP